MRRVYEFSEAEIEAAITEDPNFPAISDDDLRDAVAVSANGRVKHPVSIRLDEEILEYYRSLGPRYQTRINHDLLALVRERKLERAAADSKQYRRRKSA
ncbi:MAG: BrnA antitoxin family protein [Longimicrobiaceae bacterium]